MRDSGWTNPLVTKFGRKRHAVWPPIFLLTCRPMRSGIRWPSSSPSLAMPWRRELRAEGRDLSMTWFGRRCKRQRAFLRTARTGMSRRNVALAFTA
jgi:hypothetical protein